MWSLNFYRNDPQNTVSMCPVKWKFSSTSFLNVSERFALECSPKMGSWEKRPGWVPLRVHAACQGLRGSREGVQGVQGVLPSCDACRLHSSSQGSEKGSCDWAAPEWAKQWCTVQSFSDNLLSQHFSLGGCFYNSSFPCNFILYYRKYKAVRVRNRIWIVCTIT